MYKWKVYDVPGDGNCLFSALGKSLDISASNLRHIAVQGKDSWSKNERRTCRKLD